MATRRASTFWRTILELAQCASSYVKWQHTLWLKSGKDGPRPENEENKMRRFRIEDTDPNDYRRKWGLFD